jgi:hypothetical protein
MLQSSHWPGTLQRVLARQSTKKRYWRGSGADPVEKDTSTAATLSRREITRPFRHVTGKNCRLWKGEYCEMNGSGFLYLPLVNGTCCTRGARGGNCCASEHLPYFPTVRGGSAVTPLQSPSPPPHPLLLTHTYLCKR